jgi:outer membrane protein assembly factor BamA
MKIHTISATLKTLVVIALFFAPDPAQSQPQPAETRTWEIAGVPAVNYDSDEGFGYGAIAELYRHGSGARPYLFTVQPAVQLSTRGKRDVTLFFDAPHLLPGEWRLDAFVGSEQHLASPYYGTGNRSGYDASLDAAEGPNPYYYRFGRTRRQASTNLQHPVPGTPLRGLVGLGVSETSVDTSPFDHGTTLLSQHIGAGPTPGGVSSNMRAGMIWDTRDREIAPTRGAWSEVLVQRFDAAFGSDFEYTRWTVTDRRYQALGTDRLVFANRFLLQGVQGDAPFYDLFVVQTSFKQQEGLGGAKTVRGLPKNRYAGKGLFLWNAELRWKAAEFRAAGRPLHLVLSGFLDSGRVWDEQVVFSEVASDHHRGVGAGVRMGTGETFTVGVDVGHSAEGTPFYIGLGYLY